MWLVWPAPWRRALPSRHPLADPHRRCGRGGVAVADAYLYPFTSTLHRQDDSAVTLRRNDSSRIVVSGSSKRRGISCRGRTGPIQRGPTNR